MKRHHDQGNTYRKHLIWGFLTVLEAKHIMLCLGAVWISDFELPDYSRSAYKNCWQSWVLQTARGERLLTRTHARTLTHLQKPPKCNPSAQCLSLAMDMLSRWTCSPGHRAGDTHAMVTGQSEPQFWAVRRTLCLWWSECLTCPVKAHTGLSPLPSTK